LERFTRPSDLVTLAKALIKGNGQAVELGMKGIPVFLPDTVEGLKELLQNEEECKQLEEFMIGVDSLHNLKGDSINTIKRMRAWKDWDDKRFGELLETHIQRRLVTELDGAHYRLLIVMWEKVILPALHLCGDQQKLGPVIPPGTLPPLQLVASLKRDDLRKSISGAADKKRLNEVAKTNYGKCFSKLSTSELEGILKKLLESTPTAAATSSSSQSTSSQSTSSQSTSAPSTSSPPVDSIMGLFLHTIAHPSRFFERMDFKNVSTERGEGFNHLLNGCSNGLAPRIWRHLNHCGRCLYAGLSAFLYSKRCTLNFLLYRELRKNSNTTHSRSLRWI
jgi:hypothetical protein